MERERHRRTRTPCAAAARTVRRRFGSDVSAQRRRASAGRGDPAPAVARCARAPCSSHCCCRCSSSCSASCSSLCSLADVDVVIVDGPQRRVGVGVSVADVAVVAHRDGGGATVAKCAATVRAPRLSASTVYNVSLYRAHTAFLQCRRRASGWSGFVRRRHRRRRRRRRCQRSSSRSSSGGGGGGGGGFVASSTRERRRPDGGPRQRGRRQRQLGHAVVGQLVLPPGQIAPQSSTRGACDRNVSLAPAWGATMPVSGRAPPRELASRPVCARLGAAYCACALVQPRRPATAHGTRDTADGEPHDRCRPARGGRLGRMGPVSLADIRRFRTPADTYSRRTVRSLTW